MQRVQLHHCLIGYRKNPHQRESNEDANALVVVEKVLPAVWMRDQAKSPSPNRIVSHGFCL